jgi:hypothetical protein
LEFSVAGWRSVNLNLLWPHIHALALYLIPFSYMPCLFFRYKPSLFSRISFLSFWLGIIGLNCNMARKYPFSKNLWVQHTFIVGWLYQLQVIIHYSLNWDCF